MDYCIDRLASLQSKLLHKNVDDKLADLYFAPQERNDNRANSCSLSLSLSLLPSLPLSLSLSLSLRHISFSSSSSERCVTMASYSGSFSDAKIGFAGAKRLNHLWTGKRSWFRGRWIAVGILYNLYCFNATIIVPLLETVSQNCLVNFAASHSSNWFSTQWNPSWGFDATIGSRVNRNIHWIILRIHWHFTLQGKVFKLDANHI